MSLLIEASLNVAIHRYMAKHTASLTAAQRREARHCMRLAMPAARRVHAVLMACGDLTAQLIQAAQRDDREAAERLLREAVARTGDARTIRTFLAADQWEVFDIFMDHWMLGAPWSSH